MNIILKVVTPQDHHLFSYESGLLTRVVAVLLMLALSTIRESVFGNKMQMILAIRLFIYSGHLEKATTCKICFGVTVTGPLN